VQCRRGRRGGRRFALVARRASDSIGKLPATQFDPVPNAAPADGVHDVVSVTMFQSKKVNTKIRMF
jgi:hypothetical protein